MHHTPGVTLYYGIACVLFHALAVIVLIFVMLFGVFDFVC